MVLDACAELDPTAAVVVAEFRQLLRGETARRQLFKDGRVPEFLGEPTEAQRLSLAAVVALRNDAFEEAGKLVAQAEEARPHPRGSLRGTPFDDMRDADDMLEPAIEVAWAHIQLPADVGHAHGAMGVLEARDRLLHQRIAGPGALGER